MMATMMMTITRTSASSKSIEHQQYCGEGSSKDSNNMSSGSCRGEMATTITANVKAVTATEN